MSKNIARENGKFYSPKNADLINDFVDTSETKIKAAHDCVAVVN